MRTLRFAVLLVFTWSLALAVTGCGGGNTDDKSEDKVKRGSNTAVAEGKGSGSGKELKALEAKGTGTLKGVVKLNGTVSPKNVIDPASKDKAHCLAAPDKSQTLEQTWQVGPNSGLKYVVVWLRAPQGSYFS